MPAIISQILQMIRLLSVGRFCTAKNYDNVPDVCRRMLQEPSLLRRARQEGLRWFLIGFGPDEALIRRRIAEAGMEDHVVILGKKANPYPYIRHCDLYVQPSRYEGKSVTVREAQMLGRPVVVTDYPTASSQVTDGVDGVIVPMDNAGCARGIVDVLTDDALRGRITDHLRSHDYAGTTEVEKIYSLIPPP